MLQQSVASFPQLRLCVQLYLDRSRDNKRGPAYAGPLIFASRRAPRGPAFACATPIRQVQTSLVLRRSGRAEAPRPSSRPSPPNLSPDAPSKLTSRTLRAPNGQTCANTPDQPVALTLTESHLLYRVTDTWGLSSRGDPAANRPAVLGGADYEWPEA